MSIQWDYAFRLIVIGDSGVGKSTFLNVFANNLFPLFIEETLGVDYFARTITLLNGERIRLHVCDTAGQEKYRSVTSHFYRSAVGALLLFDVTRRKTFDHLVNWLFEARKNMVPEKSLHLIVGCKIDLESKREVTSEEGEAFASFHGLKYIETSSKNKTNVELAFQLIAEDIYKKITSGEFKEVPEWEGIRSAFNPNKRIVLNNKRDFNIRFAYDKSIERNGKSCC